MPARPDRGRGAWRPNSYLDESIALPTVTTFRLRYLGDSNFECTIAGQVVTTWSRLGWGIFSEN